MGDNVCRGKLTEVSTKLASHAKRCRLRRYQAHLVPCCVSAGGVFTEKGLHGHERRAELCGAGGLPFPGCCAAERLHGLGFPGHDEQRETDKRHHQGFGQHGDWGGVPGNSRWCIKRGIPSTFSLALSGKHWNCITVGARFKFQSIIWIYQSIYEFKIYKIPLYIVPSI